MIPRRLRPKYVTEQYPVTFVFSGNVLSEPSVVVDVISGNDPNPAGFAGLPFVLDNLVSVVVLNGVAGCIYRITCTALVGDQEVSQVSTLAVLPSAAAIPAGTPAIPLAANVSSLPYPYWYFDSIAYSVTALPGYTYTMPQDNLTYSALALNGVLRELIQYYSMLPESISYSVAALNGTLRLLVVSYSMLPESVAYTAVALDGVLKNVLLPYLNYIPEGVSYSVVALNGTLS